MNGGSSVSSSLLLGAILLLLPLTLVSVRAKGNLPLSEVYGSNHYPIHLVKDFSQSCNLKNQCDSGNKITLQTVNKPILKKKSYSYVITKLSSSHGKPRRKLRVVNSRGRVILNIAVTLRDYLN